MNNLTRYDRDGIEIFINEAGESFASLRGVARMAGKAPSTISRFGVLRNFELQEVQASTPGGLQGIALFNENQICVVLAKYNPDRLVQFAELGIRVALYQIAGLNPPQSPVAPKGSVHPILCADSTAFDVIKDWANALIMEDFLSTVKLPTPITTYKELGQYLVKKAMAMSSWNEMLKEDPLMAPIARLTMAGKPIDPSLLADFDVADDRPKIGVRQKFVTVKSKNKGFGKPKA